VTAIAIAALWFLVRKPEPRYQVQPLSYWIDRLDYDSCCTDGQGRPTAASNEDARAIRAIGTNAIPFLVRQLKWRDSRPKAYLLEQLRRLYGPIPRERRLVLHFLRVDFRRREAARQVFGVLGPLAASAVPELVKMIEGPDDEIASGATLALNAMGPSALPALPALRRRLKQRKFDAFVGLAGLGSLAAPAVPELITLLHDSNIKLQIETSFELLRIGKEASTAVPALIDALGSSNSNVRDAAAAALDRIGVTNRSVMDAISKHRNAPDPVVRD